MNPSQEHAWTALHDCYIVDVRRGDRETSVASDARVDWTAAFGRTAPLFVEIGTGTGEALAALAARHEDANVVAFEVFEPGVASTLSRLARENVTNVRIVVADAVQGLAALFEPRSITELWTFFPDPWHKKRHHKRRLVNAEFARLVASRLIVSGRWRLATDWTDYADWIRDVCDAEPGLRNEHDDWAPRFEERPVTKFEQRGLAAGRRIYDLSYVAADSDVPLDERPAALTRPLADGEQRATAERRAPLVANQQREPQIPRTAEASHNSAEQHAAEERQLAQEAQEAKKRPQNLVPPAEGRHLP